MPSGEETEPPEPGEPEQLLQSQKTQSHEQTPESNLPDARASAVESAQPEMSSEAPHSQIHGGTLDLPKPAQKSRLHSRENPHSSPFLQSSQRLPTPLPGSVNRPAPPIASLPTVDVIAIDAPDSRGTDQVSFMLSKYDAHYPSSTQQAQPHNRWDRPRKTRLGEPAIFSYCYSVPSAIQNVMQAKYRYDPEMGDDEFTHLRCGWPAPLRERAS